jgi:hypothetical protein
VLTEEVGEEAAAAGVEEAPAGESGGEGEVDWQGGGGAAGGGVSKDEERGGRSRFAGAGGGNEAAEQEKEEEESHASRVVAPTKLGLFIHFRRGKVRTRHVN